ncbi:glutathione Stransferase domain containing protein [Acanthamoeba castellanii str. Neff]|uniref:Glutathione Stransferase domain containing protein n=1 Tax=Acanthamoeba castellanii (strain ATCC 30010 / Neff) TaxID=1257118 RepID=L8HI41_ACACF|nr:glutathione Stransferase domain containing protein [Acanthamoeba castellanii str. Neff]ELR25249.1 glutathione Stransferase domain containing protein [Acanthamoeba castellanii str. Neff]
MATQRIFNSLQENDKTTGRFERKPTSFRDKVTADGSSGYKAEAGRYHLYVSYACPWASRCLAFRSLKGLQDAIPVHTVAPRWGVIDEPTGAKSWVFSDQEIGGRKTNDGLNNTKSMRELYELHDPQYADRYTVPVLWDSQTKKIVNNESSEIIRMFNTEFNAFAKHPEVDLYPAEQREEIDALNTWMYETINNGVYKCGFATSQAAYEEAFQVLFATLDDAEEKLSKTRFLGGNKPNEADIRLFVTLVRFDPVYVQHFKTNKKRIADYPNLWGYTRDVYQWPGIAETVNLVQIKEHYFGSHPRINPLGIVPAGPEIDFATPHGRDQLFA